MSEEREMIEAVRTAFVDEFKPFAELSVAGLSLDSAEQSLHDLNALKVRHTGKKSPIAGTMKLIGKVAPEERSAFGQMVQSVEKEIVASIEAAETTLRKV